METTSAGLREGESNTADSETRSSDQQQGFLLLPCERGHISVVLRQSTSISKCLVALRGDFSYYTHIYHLALTPDPGLVIAHTQIDCKVSTNKLRFL